METLTKPKVKKAINKLDFLKELKIKQVSYGACTGTEWLKTAGKLNPSYSPVDNHLIGEVKLATREDYEKVIRTAERAFHEWKKNPAPKRGEIVRQMGDELRRYKRPLGQLVSYEMGKSLQEGMGEV